MFRPPLGSLYAKQNDKRLGQQPCVGLGPDWAARQCSCEGREARRADGMEVEPPPLALVHRDVASADIRASGSSLAWAVAMRWIWLGIGYNI